MNTIEELESAVSRLSPDELAEFSTWFQIFVTRQVSANRDLEIINRHANELNEEAADVLGYQVFP